MTLYKKLGVGLGTSVASMAMMASSAFAAPIVNTGDFFSYTNVKFNAKIAKVSNYNSAYISQTSLSGANTGGNTANRNILGGQIRTGSAYVSTTQSVSANNNWTSIRF